MATKHMSLLIADDGKFFPKSSQYAVNPIHLALLSQEDLHSLEAWCITSCLDFNVVKSFILRFALSKHTVTNFNYVLIGIQLSVKDQCKDLGVIISCDLTWSNHHIQRAIKLLLV